jgi:membrane peptidoglycan carboxypeptidase
MASITRLIIKRRRRRAAQQARQSQQSVILSMVSFLLVALVVLPIVIVVGRVLWVYAQADAKIPDPQQTILTATGGTGRTQLYDASGRTLLFAVSDPLGIGRQWLTLEELPDYVVSATIAWEDPNFLRPQNLSLWAVGESLWRNWTANTMSPAGSSITARLVRRVILRRSQDQPVTRDERADEIALIAAVNRRYTPDEILEWHLNTNYYGNEAYGIEAAAQVYFGKSARDLTLDEAALLAAVTTAPQFNPLDDETRARDRQSDLLRRMLSAGAMTQSQFEAVINVNTPIRLGGGQTPDLAPDFSFYARRQAETILNNLGYDGVQLVARGGLRIITTLDMDLYDQTECLIAVHVARLGAQDPNLTTRTGAPCHAADYLPESFRVMNTPPDSGSVVVISPQTGEILTMNGRTTADVYQPGPTLYPIVYLHGFLNASTSYTGATMLLDIPRTYPAGTGEGAVIVPGNPDGQFYGPLTLREAMSAGLVPPVFEVANTLNINNVIRDTAHQIGINGLRDSGYTLSLLGRGGGVSVLDMAYVYATFAAMGDSYGLRVTPRAEGLRDHDPIAVRRIEDAEGNILWNYDATQITQSRVLVLQPQIAYVMNDILADSSARAEVYGAENVFELGRPAAVVNGLTSDGVDNWTVGYTPQLAIATHLGRANRGVMTIEGFGLEGSAQVWRALMDYAHERDSLPVVEWQTPSNIVRTAVCDWEIIDINTQTGQRASVTTPPNQRNAVTYFIPPTEALDWWQANGLPLPPSEFDTISRPDILSSTAILLPSSYDIVGGVVDVRGSMTPDGLAFYQLSYGAGPNPSEWINITPQQTTFTPGVSLAEWNTQALNGTYILWLRVVRDDNSVESSYVQVIVDNVPPSLTLRLADGQSPVRYPEQRTIRLVADAVDNISVARVEFYHEGELIFTDTEFPFEYEHPITRIDTESFAAIVYDAVGNADEDALEVEVIRSSSG